MGKTVISVTALLTDALEYWFTTVADEALRLFDFQSIFSYSHAWPRRYLWRLSPLTRIQLFHLVEPL
jgi:hypothetical protein